MMTDDWATWIEADIALRGRLSEEVQRQLDSGVPLFEEFFGSDQPPVAALETFGPGVVLGSFTEWAVGDRRARAGTATVVEEWLASAELSAAERTLLEARRDAWVTIVLVVAVTPGEQLVVADVFSEKPIVVNDPILSVDSLYAAVFPARLCEVGDERLMIVAGPSLKPAELEEVREEIEFREPLGLRHRSDCLGMLFERVAGSGR